MPDFDDYFHCLENYKLQNKFDITIDIESSRGFWWGEHAHCTFCGLNGSTMRFRSKSSDRVLDEVKYLSKKYNINSFRFTDNILNTQYFNDFFPKIVQQKVNLSFFYETRSNLTKDQLIIMRNAGIKHFQPGIESFSDVILDMMKKGVTGLQNIQTLKWCLEIGITPYWNILMGFPREPKEEYAKMSNLIPLIEHLNPPERIVQIKLTRYSPYFFESKKYGLFNVRPYKFFNLMYPFSDETVRNLVYIFDYEYEDKRNIEEYWYMLKNLIESWKKSWEIQPPNYSRVHLVI